MVSGWGGKNQVIYEISPKTKNTAKMKTKNTANTHLISFGIKLLSPIKQTEKK
jgi:hypothetical protein